MLLNNYFAFPDFANDNEPSKWGKMFAFFAFYFAPWT